jgi:hypothetical protein
MCKNVIAIFRSLLLLDFPAVLFEVRSEPLGKFLFALGYRFGLNQLPLELEKNDLLLPLLEF